MTEQIYGRVSQVFAERYGRSLRFINMVDPTAQDSELIVIAERNMRSAMIITRNDLLMPVVENGSLVLVALLKDGGHLLPSEMEHMRRCLDLLVMMVPKTTRQSAIRIVDFENHVSSSSSLLSTEKTDSFALASEDRELHPRIPILIEADKSAPVRELALELHHISNQMLFIALNDLSDLKTMKDLKDLGALTLFIPDISKVDREVQALLTQYHNEVPLDDRDLRVIAVCDRAPETLVLEECVSVEFIEAIRGGSIKWSAQHVHGATISEMIQFYVRSMRPKPPRLTVVREEAH